MSPGKVMHQRTRGKEASSCSRTLYQEVCSLQGKQDLSELGLAFQVSVGAGAGGVVPASQQELALQAMSRLESCTKCLVYRIRKAIKLFSLPCLSILHSRV